MLLTVLGAVGSVVVKGAAAIARVTARAIKLGAKAAANVAKNCVNSVVEQTRQVNEAARSQRMEEERKEAERLARRSARLSSNADVSLVASGAKDEDANAESAVSAASQKSPVADSSIGVGTHPVNRMHLD